VITFIALIRNEFKVIRRAFLKSLSRARKKADRAAGPVLGIMGWEIWQGEQLAGLDPFLCSDRMKGLGGFPAQKGAFFKFTLFQS